MKNVITTAVLLILVCCACNDTGKQEAQPSKNDSTVIKDSTVTKNTKTMKNLISIIEIPVSDFPRAVKFYQAILGLTIEEMEMDGVKMGVLPNEEGTVNVVLAKGADYKARGDAPLLYLNAGQALQPMREKVQQAGGKMIVPKTQISPEMGFFAMFIDTEGNKMGLHSAQ